MQPIVEQPRSDDDFWTPEFMRFAAAGSCVVSAMWAAFGLWVVVSAGCFDGKCGGEEGWGFGVLLLFMWVVGQIVVGIVGLVGFLWLIIAERAHRVAISFASAGMLGTAAMCGVAVIGIAAGS